MKVLIDYGQKTIEIICPTEGSSNPREEGRTSGGTCQSESPISEQEKRDSSEGSQCSKLKTEGERIEYFLVKSLLDQLTYTVIEVGQLIDGRPIYTMERNP
jgi:hypothetical protein